MLTRCVSERPTSSATNARSPRASRARRTWCRLRMAKVCASRGTLVNPLERLTRVRSFSTGQFRRMRGQSPRILRAAPPSRRLRASNASSIVFDRSAQTADERQSPVVGALVLEADEKDALPLAEAEAAVPVRNLLGPRAEQQLNEAYSPLRLERHEPLEQALEVEEEPGLALLDADERRFAVRRHI